MDIAKILTIGLLNMSIKIDLIGEHLFKPDFRSATQQKMKIWNEKENTIATYTHMN